MISYSSNYFIQLAEYVDDITHIYYRIEAKGFKGRNVWLARSATDSSEEIKNISDSTKKGYDSAQTIISSILELESLGVEGIEKVVHIYYNEEYIYLVMVYYERVEEELEECDKIMVAKMLIKTIYDMHKNHIVHNRINDNSIIVTRDNKGRLLPVIVDFENAVYVEDIPEKTIDEEKNDIWNLGVYLYSFITGDLPFSSSNVNDFSFKHFLEVYNKDLFLSDSDWDLYPEVKKIIIRALNPDPIKRADVSELLEIAN